MIEVRDVHKSFGALKVLDGIDLVVERGEVLSIIGASGSGKSTLLYCINGLEPIQAGTVRVDGVEVHAKSNDLNALRRKIGMVFQQWNAFPHLTVLENAALAPRVVLGKPRNEARDIAARQLEHVGLGDKLTVYPDRLSGGQQQHPTYLGFHVLPAALDAVLGGEVLATLRMLADEGMTMICVTHEIGFARDVSDRVAFFHKGVIEEIGPAKEVIGSPKKERTRQFLSKVL